MVFVYFGEITLYLMKSDSSFIMGGHTFDMNHFRGKVFLDTSYLLFSRHKARVHFSRAPLGYLLENVITKHIVC